jgi:hypothetical protein
MASWPNCLILARGGADRGDEGPVAGRIAAPDAALAALRSATAQYEGNPEVFRLWIAFELDKKDAANFNKVLRRAVTAQPSVVKGMAQNWVEYALQTIHKLPRPSERLWIRISAS